MFVFYGCICDAVSDECVFLVCDCRDDDSCMWASIISNGDFSAVNKDDLEHDLKVFRSDAWCVHCQVAEQMLTFLQLHDRIIEEKPLTLNQVQSAPLVVVVNDNVDGFFYCVNETVHHRLVCTCGHVRCAHVKTVALELLGIGDECEEEDRIAILSNESDCTCKDRTSFSHIPHDYSKEYTDEKRTPVLTLPAELIPTLRSCDCGSDYGCYYPCMVHDLQVPLQVVPDSRSEWKRAEFVFAGPVSHQRVTLMCDGKLLVHRKTSTDHPHKLTSCMCAYLLFTSSRVHCVRVLATFLFAFVNACAKCV